MRFVKEAKILNSVKGHRNISNFLGFCIEPHSIMMQYSSFNFGHLGVEKSVSSLDDFLRFVDSEFEFSSVASLLPVCARDILTGLDYLHNHNIAPRDLKPSNILVCNQHLNDIPRDNDEAMARAYEDCPIVCRLTDFGLSRSIDIQTKSVLMSKTSSVGCGTLAYIAPEMQLNQLVLATQEDLKRADIWSVGLVMHTMINPDLGSPYRAESEHFSDPGMALKDLLRKHQLPKHSAKYEQLRITSWWQIEYVFNQCTNFDPMARPSTAQMLSFLNKSLVTYFYRLPFSISQTTALKQFDTHRAASIQDMLPPTSQCTSLPLNDATNCCSSLSLGICDRLLNDSHFRQQPDWENVREIAEDVICHLPEKVNNHRNVGQFYDVAEAHSILSANDLLLTKYELSEECVIANKAFSSTGREEIIRTLTKKVSHGKTYLGIYTCSPYIFTIGICNNALFVVDTHPVNEELGGNGNGLLMVTPDSSYESCKSVVQWLLQRLKMAGVKGNEGQSMIWLTSSQG